MKWFKENSEVWYPEKEGVLSIAKSDIEEIAKIASRNERERARYCTHTSINDAVHEMFIYHESGTVIAPHKVSSGSESYLILEGCLDLIFYSDEGELKQVIRLSAFGGGENFFVRIPNPVFRGIVVVKDTLFVEVKEGPFGPNRVIWASWDKAKRLQSQVLDDSMIKGVR